MPWKSPGIQTWRKEATSSQEREDRESEFLASPRVNKRKETMIITSDEEEKDPRYRKYGDVVTIPSE